MSTIEHGHTAQSRGDLGAARGWVIGWLLTTVSACSAGTIEPLPALPEYSLGWVSVDGGRGADASPDRADAGPCVQCGGECVSLAEDEENCGACGTECAALATCEAGRCQCPDGLTDCDGSCVDLTRSDAHCGSCGEACAEGTTCSLGECVASPGCDTGSCACDGSTTECGDDCVDTQSDARHCGSCGVACGADQDCVAGTCTCAGPEVSFAEDVAPILERSCASTGCHGGTLVRAQLNLALDKSYAELVGVTAVQCSDGRQLVKPGRAADSYLMQKMLGTNMCAGTLMPKGASALPAAELEVIASWICRGAQH